jgi:hypothetical protein
MLREGNTHHLTTSPFSLVIKHSEKGCPTGIIDALSYEALAETELPSLKGDDTKGQLYFNAAF